MAAGACAGLAAGADSMNPKRWVCEDSVLLARLDDGAWLAAVADAHWGGLAGELAVRSALDAWQCATASDPPARLREALTSIEACLKGRGQDESETTLLLACLRAQQISWASVGDSVLWVLGRDGVTEHNEPRLHFIGRRRIVEPPTAGSAALAQGDVVLLATDGILAVTSQLEREAVAVRLREPGTPLPQRLDGLLRHVSKVGRDNLGVVALAV